MDSLQLIYSVDYSFDLRYCFQLMNLFPSRSKNVRESPPGCLVFSFTIQMEDGQVVPLLQYVVSLAVTGAVQDPCDQNVSFCFLIEVRCQPLPSYNHFISYLISKYRILYDVCFNLITYDGV